MCSFTIQRLNCVGISPYDMNDRRPTCHILELVLQPLQVMELSFFAYVCDIGKLKLPI